MDLDTAKKLLVDAVGSEEPVYLPSSILSKLSIDDVPPKTYVGVGVLKDDVIHVNWEGRLFRIKDRVIGEAGYIWSRKYWYGAIGLEQYLDLVRRAVELRHRTHGDAKLIHYHDDGAFIDLVYSVSTEEKNLGDAYKFIRDVCSQVEETADCAQDNIGKQLADIAARVSGWGSESLDALVQTVDKSSSTDEKGRNLEELCSRLFESIPGFSVTGRVRTATEEIDISILNGSDDPRFRRESALLMAECKNWTKKCGKNEFVIFREKLENRKRRCNLGFLISWNGFAKTVTQEMLRGSREEVLVIPITGKDLRAAVRDGNFPDVLAACWEKATHL